MWSGRRQRLRQEAAATFACVTNPVVLGLAPARAWFQCQAQQGVLACNLLLSTQHHQYTLRCVGSYVAAVFLAIQLRRMGE